MEGTTTVSGEKKPMSGAKGFAVILVAMFAIVGALFVLATLLSPV